MLKEHRIPMSIGLGKAKFESAKPQEMNPPGQENIKTKRTNIGQVMEEVYTNMGRISENLKFLLG